MMNKPAIKHPKTLLATIFTLNATEFLQSGMIAFAAGPIMGEIGASPEEFSFTAAMYACFAVASISKLRWFVERLGWRRYIQISIAVFAVGSVVIAGSHHLWQFLAGRALMALGGGPFMTSARTLINLIPAGPKRFKGIAAFGASLTIGSAAAPWVASMAVTRDSWNLMFGISITLALLAGAFSTVSLPSDRASSKVRAQSTLLPMIWMTCGTFLILYALQRSTYDFHGGIAMLLLVLLAGIFAIGIFVRSQLRHERPLLLLKSLAQRRILFGLGTFTFCYMILGATNYMLPVLTQRTLGFSWEVAGKIQALGMLTGVFAFIAMLKVIPKRPAPKKFYVVAFGLLFVFGWRLSSLNGNAHLLTDILPALACYGAFTPLAMVPTSLHAFRDIQDDETAFSHGQQLKNMLSQFGVSMGIALATVGFQWRVTEHYAVLSNRFVNGGAEFSAGLQELTALFSSNADPLQASQLALAQLSQQLGQQAALTASIDFFWLLTWVAAACAGFMCVQRIIK